MIYIYIVIWKCLMPGYCKIAMSMGTLFSMTLEFGGAQFLSPDLCPPILAQAAETTKMKRPQHQVDGQQVKTRFISG